MNEPLPENIKQVNNLPPAPKTRIIKYMAMIHIRIDHDSMKGGIMLPSKAYVEFAIINAIERAIIEDPALRLVGINIHIETSNGPITPTS